MRVFTLNSKSIFSLLKSKRVVLFIINYNNYSNPVKLDKKTFKGLKKSQILLRAFLIKIFENRNKLSQKNMYNLKSGIIKGTKYFQSVSYSKNFAVLALSKSRVGVDIEQGRKRYLIKGGSILSFYKDWTYKEAYCKLKNKKIINLWDKNIYNKLPHKTKLFKGFILTVVSSKKFNLYTYKYF